MTGDYARVARTSVRMTAVAEHVRFPSTSGPELGGLVDHPEGEVRGWGVFSHGFTLGKDCPAASRICKQLASEGIGMLRFDNLGLGTSDGDWGDGSFSHKVADTAQAVRFMNDSGRDVRLLVGHSFGGAAVIAAAHELESVRAVASVGAPYDVRHVEHHYDALVERILAEGEAPFLVAARPSRSSGTSWRTCARPTSTSRSAPCAGPSWSCTPRPTTRSASPTRARSSGPPGTRAASCRWRAPTTC
ncbi:alpha/beta hydrolase family protein [Nocardioides currus]|uniref:alpha/beta hydrolase family protein n=1 Tax=Nocardioides currus TaxID=2133958 RepID=UPI003C6DEAD5